MDALDKGIGDRVTATGSGGEGMELSIVGEALFPTFDENPFNDAVAFHPDLAGDIEQSDGFGQSIVSFTPGLSQDEGAQLVEELAPGAITVYAYPDQPGDVENLAQVRRMPGLLAGFLVLLALAAVGHALVISVRRRRHDLGIVRAVGFVRRQLVTCVSIQSLTLATVGLLVGVPLGVAIGRSAWALVAGGVGVSPSPTVPIGTIALLIPGALVLTALIGMLPARRAAMLRANEALAVE
jgi:predicted lysophospholipase L1 biosynthesis ABC-type transport system permease subunit